MLVLLVCKEFDSFVHGHVEHIINILTSVLYLKDIVLESFTFACLALQNQVCHELHLDSYITCSLALFTSSSLSIEGEIGRSESHLF